MKVGVYIKLDADIVEFFKRRAADPNAAPYQTQMNNALRSFMQEPGNTKSLSELVRNEKLIDALAERVRGRLTHSKL